MSAPVLSRSCAMAAHSRCRANGLTCECRCHKPGHSWAAQPMPDLANPQQAPSRSHEPEIELEWERPLRAFRQGGTADRYQAVIEKLRTQPGEWARIATYHARSSAGTSATPLRVHYPDIEFTSRKLAEGGSALYARCPAEDRSSSGE